MTLSAALLMGTTKKAAEAAKFYLTHPLAIHEAQKSALHHRE
jgi:undecaprenyl pyrophosphate phosphatase UppP